MSEIYDNQNQQILGGTMQFAAASPPQGNCEFCQVYTYNGYDFLHKLVCENCREKILKRIQLILKFE
jgi:hypothetical protein